MKILAITDLHYSDLSRNLTRKNKPNAVLARTYLKKAILRLEHLNLKPDLIVVTGDLLQGDTHPSALLDLISLKGELTRSGIPYLSLPGNHDPEADEFNRVMGTQPGLHKIGGYGFIVFNDIFEEHDTYDSCYRPQEAIDLTRRTACENPGLPLIALQHAPIFPSIQNDYPYNPQNAEQIIQSYTDSNVFLSLSGHYHDGTPPLTHHGVIYHTIPSISKAPFRFSLIELKGTNAEITSIPLKMHENFITDVHCHTEHAYCGTTTDTGKCIALSQSLGVSNLCITEHAFQLYFPKKTAMSFIWQSHPDIVDELWNTPARGRMQSYLDFAAAFRSEYVKAGLEVDLYDDGKLLLAPEDLEYSWDILVGAVHFIEGFARAQIDQKSAEDLFMRDFERLLKHGVHVMAHPFRFFGRNRLETPKHLYQPVAELLKHYNTAAEINYHTHSPDPDFVGICASMGVKLALGSDTHDLVEAGEFRPHINIMLQAGIKPEELRNHVFQIA